MDGTEPVEPQTAIPKEETRLMLARRLYEKGGLTLGQSAHLAGYSKLAFIEFLRLEGVRILD